MPYFGQELLIQAQALGGLDSDVYLQALAACRKGAREEGIDRAIREHRLDAIVAPTGGTAWLTDLINGDSGRRRLLHARSGRRLSASDRAGRAACAGCRSACRSSAPHGAKRALLGLGYAFEQATQWREEPQFIKQSSIPPLGLDALLRARRSPRPVSSGHSLAQRWPCAQSCPSSNAAAFSMSFSLGERRSQSSSVTRSRLRRSSAKIAV